MAHGPTTGVADARLPLLALVLAVGAAVLAWQQAAAVLPPSHWLSAFGSTGGDDMAPLVFRYATLPRILASLIAGAALGLAGALFQQALRNPLAVPDTLGVGAGAQLALAAATLWAPSWLAIGRMPIAFAGSALAVLTSLAIAWRRAGSPVSVILAGLVVTLYASACGTVLLLLHSHSLSGILVWAGGSFSLQDWTPVTHLAFGVVLFGLLAIPLARPLALLAVDDGSARAVGLPVAAVRILALGIGVALTAIVTGTFGTIGFISLGGPVLARAAGARRLGAVLAWSALLGSLLLCATDGAVLRLSSRAGIALPTGAATALFGTPLLIGLIGRQRGADAGLGRTPEDLPRRSGAWVLPALLALLVFVLGLALAIGRLPGIWTFALGEDFQLLLPWRASRVVGAGAAGALLAVSGLLLQRVADNPMASPEMFGLAAGAGLGLFVALCLGAEAPAQTAGAVAGAILTAVALIGWSAWRNVSPARLLLVGLALTTSLAALVSGFGATGDPRALRLIAWMAGSTAQVSPQGAASALVALAIGLPMALLAARWLDLLNVGTPSATALGLPSPGATRLLTVLAALLAGAGTLIVGPLSFAGLIVPHLARRAGLHRALPHVLGSALLGAALMIGADWVGRVVDVPWQIPSGLVAALIGGPLLIVLL